MAYQFWDGFDNYAGSTELWDSVAVSSNISYSSAYCRFPAPSGTLGQGMRIGGSASKTKNFTGNQATAIASFAIFFESLPSTGHYGFVAFNDAGLNQCFLAVLPTGALQIFNGNGSTVLGTSAPGVVTSGVWYWIDLIITINATTGAATVYLNQPVGGIALLTISSANTQRTGNAYANQVCIGDFNSSGNVMRFDDFHCHDSSGSAPNAVLGDSRIYTKKANGAGYATTWTPNGAAANWQCSDDSPPDGDTTYNANNTPGTTEGYAVPSAGFTVAPNGLVRRSYVRRDDAGPHTFQNGIRSGSTNALGTAFTVPASYAWTDCLTCYVNDPATGSPWASATPADAASMVIDETS